MRTRRSAILVVFTVVLIGAFLATIYFTQKTPGTPTVETITPHYLTYNSEKSKIYLLGATTSYGNANETYTVVGGQVVQKGDSFFIVTVTLRNDYTSDNPPPPLPNQAQTSPADGTAYLYLTTQLYDKNGAFNATNVSVSAFYVPPVSGEGVVLSSGETTTVNICLATDHLDINKCEINLAILGDSLPT